MRDAAPVEIAPVLIDIPGGAGIAAMRVAGPEADAQAAPQGFRPRRKQSHGFQHGGIGAAIVHHAVIPGVVMAREQDEGAVIALRSLDIADQKRCLTTRAESALTLFGEPELARPVFE